ncbi:MAG: SOS response-associated peptidase [Pseudomonadota bacterium]
MCGRFVILEAADEMARLFDAIPANDLPDVPNYNICPTNTVHVVHANDGTRRLIGMRWGFLPHWYKAANDGPLLINARSETIAEKPAFRAAVRARRCLIPATGFYEWTKDEEGNRQPWYISNADGAPLAFAGIWQDWVRGDDMHRTLAIVTTAANRPMSAIHHRMPVILAPKDWALWLGEEGKGAAILMQPAPDDAMQFHRVGVAVNSNRAAGPKLIEPISD